ncbi:hypothetical protein OE88DRAFT_1436698 [Heliocybe sulcata]|uniref:RING-type domain-containing protein n=1 Tax=Heliocybe sulcata TaxID=5364 RepID=A0A5C3N4H0_9AGAM|nr:hypothetical protein OE88DRAFT_1436698 [Heliocybe sulcata]
MCDPHCSLRHLVTSSHCFASTFCVPTDFITARPFLRWSIITFFMVARRRPPLAPLRLGSISEEEAPGVLNLGAETPSSILEPSSAAVGLSPDEWSRAGIAANTNIPARRRSWRSLSWLQEPHRRKFVRTQVEGDCGICFEYAIFPVRVKCCLQLFCFAHLSDWLGSEQSDGLCPACRSPCSISRDTISLISAGSQHTADEEAPSSAQNYCRGPGRKVAILLPICPPATPRSPGILKYRPRRNFVQDLKDDQGLSIGRVFEYLAVAVVLLVLFSGS